MAIICECGHEINEHKKFISSGCYGDSGRCDCLLLPQDVAEAQLIALQTAAGALHDAVDVTMIAMTKEGINIERYLTLRIGDLKDAHDALAAQLEAK